MITSIEWLDGRVRFIDQTRLPLSEEYIVTDDFNVIAEAIRSLRIRGAPLIGIAAGYAIALAATHYQGKELATFLEYLHRASKLIAATRPTAVNLAWAIDRLNGKLRSCSSIVEAKKMLVDEAGRIHREDQEMCLRIGENGAGLVPQNASILTHCNTGALATGGEGTAQSVITTAHRQGKRVSVYADETRPLLQGARLTTWELQKAGVPVTLITDSTAAALMKQKKIDLVIVGADRIASNGDTANKIGTYALAVAAHHHAVPMYVAAPSSTIDLSIETGEAIPIEERSDKELTQIGATSIAPDGVPAYTPAFDVTPASLITAIVTEAGIHRPPFVFRKMRAVERALP